MNTQEKENIIGKKCFVLRSPDPNVDVNELGMVTISSVSLGEYSNKLGVQIITDRYNCQKGKELRSWTFLEDISIVNEQLLTQKQIELWNKHTETICGGHLTKEKLVKDFYQLDKIYNCFDWAVPQMWLDDFRDHHKVKYLEQVRNVNLSWMPYVMTYPKEGNNDRIFGRIRPLTAEVGEMLDAYFDREETTRILKEEREALQNG